MKQLRIENGFFIPMIDELKNIGQDKILLEIVEPTDAIREARGFLKYRRFSTKKYLKMKQEEKGIIGCREASPDLSENYKRSLGILKGKASYKIKEDFKITDEELLLL